MSNDIYINLLNRKIDNFVKIFSNDSNIIFKNDNKKLIHPGEYGKYRERACKEVLKFILKDDVEISDGFLITANNNISTQCDIIIYNISTVQLISDNIARMFPIEDVRVIGEIKSNLSKKDFQEALIKLSRNKMLQDERKNTIIKKKFQDETYNTLPTFLICNKLEFDYDKINLEDIYKDIPRKYWHNAILSIEDGFISYALDFRKGNDNTLKILTEKKYNFKKLGIWSYPYKYFYDDIIETRENVVYLNKQDKYHHIIDFFANIAGLVNDVFIYEHDPIEYLGLNTKSFFLEE